MTIFQKRRLRRAMIAVSKQQKCCHIKDEVDMFSAVAQGKTSTSPQILKRLQLSNEKFFFLMIRAVHQWN